MNTRASANQAMYETPRNDADNVNTGVTPEYLISDRPDRNWSVSLDQVSRASSASPTVRTPTSSHPDDWLRSAGSMFASGMTQR